MAIQKRTFTSGATSYVVRVRDPRGKWYPTKSFERRVDAERYERQLGTQRDEGRVVDGKGVRDLIFADFIARWAGECRGHVSAGWRISQDQMIRDFVIPILGQKRLLDVGPQDVDQVLKKAGERLAPQTVKHVYSMLRKMFVDAVEHYGLQVTNPVLRRYRPRIAHRHRAFLKPAESWRLLESVSEHYLGPAIWLGTLAGLRISEIQALRWSGVDFDTAQISIRAAYNRKEKRLQDHPKQEDWGRVPMMPALRDYLLERRGEHGAFVAPGRDGSSMLSYETMEDALKRLCRKIGLHPLTPHELRHSCTEIWIDAGASAEDIRRLLNQKSLTATAHYIHRTDERLSRLAAGITATTTSSPLSSSSSSTGASSARLRLISSPTEAVQRVGPSEVKMGESGEVK